MADRFSKSKNAKNLSKHGISLDRAFDMEIIRFVEDDRVEYGEVRYRAWGLIDGRYHYLAYTIRDGLVWPISLRRAHRKEWMKNVGKEKSETKRAQARRKSGLDES